MALENVTIPALLNMVLSSNTSLDENDLRWFDNGTNNYGDHSFNLPSETIKKIQNICILVVMLVVMLSMGCDMNFTQIYSALKKPVGVLTGMVCQFGIMPLAGFTLIKTLGVEGLFGTGILLVSCCPGGSISNILTFLAKGDITMSVTMTTLSTAIALGMMPLNMWLYGHGMDTGDIVIPYGSIAMSLVYITSPVAIGMIIHWRMPKLAPRLVKAGSLFGFVAITSLCIFDVVLYWDLYRSAPWQLYLTSILMLPFGYTIGFTAALLLRQDARIQRTIGIESGVQNASLAMSIAYMSFTMPAQTLVRVFPVIYGVAQAFIGFACCAIYRVYLSCCDKAEKKEITGKSPIVMDTVLTEKLLTGEDANRIHVEIKPINYCDHV